MKKKILLVEDREAVRNVTRLLLTSMGFEVVAASDGLEALGLISEVDPDLILSDIDMPNLDGIAFAESLETDTPVILMTGNADKHRSRIAAMKKGISFILHKPFTRNGLWEAVERYMRIGQR